MSKIDELLKKYCPDGVEFRELGELLDYEQPGRYIVDSTNYSNEYSTPVLTAGQSFILGRTNESHGIYEASEEEPIIIFDDFTTTFHWVDFDFKVKSSAMKMLRPKSDTRVNFRFVYFAMRCINYNSTVHARHWISQYSKFKIPMPPLEIQHEIVNILNNFTSLEMELEAELQARKEQYEYYRDKLFSFDGDKTVNWVPLGRAGEFIRGRRFTKEDYVDEGIGVIHYGEIYTHYGTFADKVKSHVRKELEPKLRFAKPGDVVITDVGETVEDVGKAVAWLGNGEVAIHDHCYAFRHTMNPKFVSYYMQTSRFRSDKSKYVARTKVKTLQVNGLAKVCMPVPSMAEQNRIVSILSNFDLLVNSVSEGLPAEISARHKQYEHYRDKLLVFQELMA